MRYVLVRRWKVQNLNVLPEMTTIQSQYLQYIPIPNNVLILPYYLTILPIIR